MDIISKSTRPFVKSPFLEKPLPIPSFILDVLSTSTEDDGNACNVYNKATQLVPCKRFEDDASFDRPHEETPLRKRKTDHNYLDPKPFRRSSRQRIPVDFGKLNLEVPSTDYEDEQPNSERRELRNIHCRLLDGDNTEPKDGFYESILLNTRFSFLKGSVKMLRTPFMLV